MKEIKCPNCGEVFTVDESGYAEIAAQVRNAEFNRELNARTEQLKKDAATEQELREAKSAQRIKELEMQIAAFGDSKKLAVAEALAEKDQEILKVKEEASKLRLDMQAARSEFESQLRMKDEEVKAYKDFKAKQSTKMIGESLEQHCHDEFDKVRHMAFPRAYFEKDNEVSKATGSKGDFIFRDYDENGAEFVSIMFEMKNQADDTDKKSKHTNESFLKELDKDRREKKCEYAVLVSLLEEDSELYNQGIVDMSHRYEKMYVIRPQFFLPMISLIRNAALTGLSYRQQLMELKNQNVDVSRFETALTDFKEKFGNNFRLAGEHYKTAIDSIDKSIAALEKSKDELVKSMKQLQWANDKAEDLSIKSLCKNNPTMTEKFAALEEG